jgi:hypothetical protein
VPDPPDPGGHIDHFFLLTPSNGADWAFFARHGYRDSLAGGAGLDRARIDPGLDRRRSIERLLG